MEGGGSCEHRSSLRLAAVALLGAPNTDGFYLSGFAGAARITIEDESGDRSAHEPVGGAVAAAAGYEWLLSDHLALGLMVRATGGSLGDDGMHHSVAAFSLLGSLSWY